MNKNKVITSIVGAALIAGLASAIGFFPEIKEVLTAISGLIGAIVGYIVGKK